MGFWSGLNAEHYDRKYSDRELFRRILVQFRPQRARMGWIVLTVLILASAGAANPLIVSRGVDLLKDQISGWAMVAVCGAVILLGVISWLANYAQRRLAVRAVSDVVLSLATRAFGAAAHHDMSFHDEVPSGKIVSRITSDTQDFGQLVMLTTDVVAQTFEALVLAIILIGIEWRLSLYMFILIPIVFVFALVYRRLARKVTREGMRAMANVNSTIKETISGMAVAKNFRQEASVYQDFTTANLQSYRVNFRRGLALSFIFPTLNALGGMMSALLIYVGGLSVADGLVTAGAWYLFLSSLDRFLFPVMNISSFWTQIQNGLSASERVFGLIDAKPVVVQKDARNAPQLKGDIVFEHVFFQYKENEPVLEDFNLRIAPGENLALVGHTGAGKSSVAKLTARLYEFQQGRILIDGLDIRSFDLNSYRRQLGIVSQVPFLFSGTVAENIRYANPDVPAAVIDDLSHQIGDGEWLEALPDGLNTNVGERGSRLSMGQRQLVSLMRVLVQRPAIFILDEATASIDPFTEWQIQQALKLILAQSTSILIAHRLSTVRSADRILVIEKGRIIEEGNHTSLLQQAGHYASLYNAYFRHQSLAYVEQAHEMRSNLQTEAAA